MNPTFVLNFAVTSKSYDILVIILATALALFLILAIVLTIYLIRIAKHVNQITLKAESLVDNIKSASQTMKSAAGPIAVSKIISTAIGTYVNSKRKKGE